MKVYISLDMEGVSGLVRWEDVAGNGPEYTRGCRILTADLNAAIAGACDAGADEVLVEENHSIQVELKNYMSEGLRQNLETMPEFEIVNSRVVRTQADDMGMGFRRIAYLSTQRISTLPIVGNNFSRLIFRLQNCRTYQAILEKCGQNTAELLTCQHGCLTLCEKIMEGLRLDGIEAEMSARTPDDGHCQFILKNTEAY